jgi:hypothetical protein
MPQQLPAIDFKQIRCFQQSQNKGFEELAVQIFRRSLSGKKEFYRVDDGGGDGGVEDIAVLPSGEKFGMQAKYVSPASKLWGQLNKSVLTALETHKPHLREYHIFAPCNRSKSSKSWNNHVIKWNEKAQKLGYKNPVSFIWHGESEIHADLIKDANRDLLHYWFGARRFSPEWLQEQLDVSLNHLDHRYTPDHHVETESQQVLNAFFQTDGFIRQFHRIIRELVDQCQDQFNDRITELEQPIESFNAATVKLATLFQGSNLLPSAKTVREVLEAVESTLVSLEQKFYDLQKKKADPKKPHDRPYGYELNKVDRLLDQNRKALRFLRLFTCYDLQFLLVRGEAGNGKSHLFAKAAETALRRDQACVLIPGERFSDARPLHLQICESLEWEEGYESLLGALNIHGLTRDKPSVILIDAINESHESRLWKTQLPGLVGKLKNFPFIRLAISCRSDFLDLCLFDKLVNEEDDDWAYLDHRGFETEVFNAVTAYFNGYGIQSSQFPPVLDEFKNPLFLKLFCEAFAGEQIPRGTLSFGDVIEKRIAVGTKSIFNLIECGESRSREAIADLAAAIAKNNGQAIPISDARTITESHWSEQKESKSLLRHLLSAGLLSQTLLPVSEEKESKFCEAIRFPYERFSDYLICSQILSQVEGTDFDKLRSNWAEKNLPSIWLADWHAFQNARGLLRMFAILVPERFQQEFLDLVDEKQSAFYIGDLYEDFLHSLPWRSARSITDRTSEYNKRCFEHFDYTEYLNLRLKVATIPNHPLNVERVHSLLKELQLPDRERSWTMPITDLTRYEDENTVNDIIRWAFRVPFDRLSDEQAWLVALFLSWLLGTNYRFLRLRASRALIRVLLGRCHLVARLLDEFHGCNDPYIVERVYAAACGVALREKNQKAVSSLALKVYEKMFSGEKVPPHVLQRDFAQLVIERAAYLKVLDPAIALAACRPPFKSKRQTRISEAELQKLEKEDGWNIICQSLRPNDGGGWYGDFGRYEMESKIHQFSDQRLGRPFKKHDKRKGYEFSGLDARRYILRRIQNLGWRPSLFGEYDKRLSHGRMRTDEEEIKVERIGKKYQWIGLHELLGFLGDNFWMPPDYGDEDDAKTFQGAWEIWAREFDPTHPLIDPIEIQPEQEQDAHREDDSWIQFPDPLSDISLVSDRERWVKAHPENFASLIEFKDPGSLKGDWLTLHGHFNWKENPPIGHNESQHGILKTWVDMRCWLVEKKKRAKFLEQLERTQLWGSGCGTPELHSEWIGEYPWAPSTQNTYGQFFGDGWISGREAELVQTYCSVRDSRPTFSAIVPGPIVFELMNLHWGGEGYDYFSESGELTACCLPYNGSNPQCYGILLIRRDPFLEALEKADLVPVWAMISERDCFSSSGHHSIVKEGGVVQSLYGIRRGRLQEIHRKEDVIPFYR